MSVCRRVLVVLSCVGLIVVAACARDGLPSEACRDWSRARLGVDSWNRESDNVSEFVRDLPAFDKPGESGLKVMRDLLDEHGEGVIQACEDDYLRWRYQEHGY